MIKRLIAVMLIAGCAAGQGILPGLLAYKNAHAWPTIREDDCIFAYDFSDGTATDKSGYGHDGVLSNVTWVAATSTNSAYMEFAGTNTSFIDVPDFVGTNRTEFTIAFWVNFYSTDKFFFLGTWGGLALSVNTYATSQFYMHTKSGNYWLLYINTSHGPEWYHIVVTFSKSANKIYVYQNGLRTLDNAATPCCINWDEFALGRMGNDGQPTATLYGALSQVQMWDVALSSNESYQVSQEDVDGFPQP